LDGANNAIGSDTLIGLIEGVQPQIHVAAKDCAPATILGKTVHASERVRRD
jgi:hypothetical protein